MSTNESSSSSVTEITPDSQTTIEQVEEKNKQESKDNNEEKEKAEEKESSSEGTKQELSFKRKTSSNQEETEQGTKRRKVETEESSSNGKNASTQERIVPPSSKPISKALFISNFVRPFRKQSVQALLTPYGEIEHWDMDNIKSKCWIIYQTESQAEAARNALHNLVWPPANRTALSADFCSEEEAKKYLGIPTTTPSKAPLNITISTTFNNDNTSITVYSANNGSKSVTNNLTKPNSSKTEVKTKTLDDLFLKTTTTPHIYYLPLSDEEVKKRQEKK